MTDLRTAALRALEALEYIRSTTVWQADKHAANPAITALKAALEKPEPVAWTTMPDADDWMFVSGTEKPPLPGEWHPLYTHPPRREWRGLKEWEINDGRDQLPTEDLCNWSFRQGVYFAEKALKERNA
jgi:hypothetical protein